MSDPNPVARLEAIRAGIKRVYDNLPKHLDGPVGRLLERIDEELSILEAEIWYMTPED